MKSKWYTCTPVSFAGNEAFFFRDTGLLCRGLQAVGYESRAVMPLPAHDGDHSDVLRAPFDKLCSASWWASRGLDGVLIYSWSDPRYTGVVRAIRRAGIRLFVNLDNDGIISPYSSFLAYCRHQYDRQHFRHSSPVAFGITLFRVLLRLCALGAIDYRRLVHLAQADLVGVVSPVAAERMQRYCRRLGCARLAERVVCIPHPISTDAFYAGEEKDECVLFAGRWDDCFQKNPTLLLDTIRECVRRQSGIYFYVVGRGLEERLQALYAACPAAEAWVTYQEHLPHEALIARMKHCRIIGCTSRYESFHLVSAEGLCCGCSVVGPNRPMTPTFPWFISENSGTLAARYTAESFANALEAEMTLWKEGSRSAQKISEFGKKQFHVDQVLKNIVNRMVSAGTDGERIQ